MFAHVLLGTEVNYSHVLTHFLHSNGFMAPSDDIESIMKSRFTHLSNSPLVQIVTKAQENTGLVITSNEKDPFSFQNTKHIERACFNDFLQTSNILNFHQITLKHAFLAECNVDAYLHVLYWTKKDFNFLLSIKAFKNMGLNIVMQSLNGKVIRLTEEFEELKLRIPSYNNQIMNVYRAHGLPAPPLPPLDVKRAKANVKVGPKVLYALFSQLLQGNIISANFIESAKETISSHFLKFIKSKGKDIVTHALNSKLFQPAFKSHIDLYYSVSNGWLAFWLLAMRIRRPMPSLSVEALGPSLIESFNLEIKAMNEILKEDYMSRKYALNCSCLHITYLIDCLHLALIFDLLNHQDHSSCVDLIMDHRNLALEMIINPSRKTQ